MIILCNILLTIFDVIIYLIIIIIQLLNNYCFNQVPYDTNQYISFSGRGIELKLRLNWSTYILIFIFKLIDNILLIIVSK